MIIPDRIKITLVLGGVTSDVTKDIVEWDSLEILEERDNVSGVITSVSFPVKLRGQGMELMKAAFDKDGLYSTGTMNVYQRGDHDSDYTLIKASPLDFSTYEEHDSYVSVECAESELSDILNSEGKTKFDIPVNDIKETKQWKYDRMQVKNIGIYTLPEDTDISYSDDDFDKLFTDAQNLLRNTELKEKDLDQLYEKGGSSGGARPKVNVLYDKEPWLVKFPSSFDGDDAGEKEYECNLRAADAGINVAKFKLIKSKITKGFFASKRFDRIDGKRIHMASLSAILESSHRYPALDYYHLLKVTEILTHSEKETEEAFRRACFNVFIENQDDHGKNFAFLYDDGKREWHLSPAYDITSTQTSFGEHSTTVMKKGKSISSDDLRRLADEFTIKQSVREEILRDTWKAAKA